MMAIMDTIRIVNRSTPPSPDGKSGLPIWNHPLEIIEMQFYFDDVGHQLFHSLDLMLNMRFQI